jgi:hypothetical protein
MSRQKTLFPEADGDITHFGQKLPGDFADYILLEPEELDPGDDRVIVGPLEGGKQP